MKGDCDMQEPITSQVERAAYHAAHRIMTEDLENQQLAGEGAKRTYRTDRIAGIIMDALGERKNEVCPCGH